MRKQSVALFSLLLAALLIIPWSALGDDPWANARWRVNVTHDLNGGQWQQNRSIPPYTMEAKIGENMSMDALWQERSFKPVRDGYDFKGWSVRFTSATDGTLYFDSGIDVWDLNEPFGYYPNNHLTMNCKMTAQWMRKSGLADDVWQVLVSHDLQGGSWPDGLEIKPYTLTGKVGQPMAKDSLGSEQVIQPFMSESTFLGWSVLFTDAANDKIVYDGRGKIWNLSEPFQYYPKDPRLMRCLMIANWQSSQSPGLPPPEQLPPGPLAQEILPDGRLMTWPYPLGMDPLPEAPPPAEQVIEGTQWLRGGILAMIGKEDLVPVYAFPVYNAPVLGWIGIYEKLDYGMYLPDNWTMFYNPLWVENGGIGFVVSDYTAFPGSE